MESRDSGARLCTITIKAVTQPGQDPSELFGQVSEAVRNVCGKSAPTSRPDDPEAGVQMNSVPLWFHHFEEAA